MKKIIILIVIVILSSCYVEPVTYHNDILYPTNLIGFKEYKIKKGEHTSGTHINLTYTDNIEAYIQLTESCNYVLENITDQNDINKIIGLSDALNHHTASARIGWKSINNQLEIWAYVRQNNEHTSYFLGKVQPNEMFYVKIEIFPLTYKFTFKEINNQITIKRLRYYTGVRYQLNPYFGGNQKAPHDMIIKIKKL